MFKEPTTQIQKPELCQCKVGEWVSVRDAPWNKPGMQEFVPPGHPDNALPWFFTALYNGPNVIGWERVE